MKINYDKKTYSLDSIKEEPIKKRYWDRWIYIAILVIISLSFFYWLIRPVIYTSADGILLQQQFDVRFARDIRISQYNVKEGQEIKIGDTLFLYEDYNEKRLSSFEQDSIQFVLQQENKATKLISIDAQIEKRRLLIIELKERLKFWEREKERKKKLVYLDVITPNELANVDRFIDDVSYALYTAQSEYQVLQQEKSRLQQSYQMSQTIGNSGIIANHQTLVYKSPRNGKIDRLRIPQNQVCYNGDIVASILYPDYYVRAYLKMKDLNKYKIGDKVSVILPYDNHNLSGIVSKIYSVSEAKEEIIKDWTMNAENYGLMIEIYPEKIEEWNVLPVSNIPVKVQKRRI